MERNKVRFNHITKNLVKYIVAFFVMLAMIISMAVVPAVNAAETNTDKGSYDIGSSDEVELRIRDFIEDNKEKTPAVAIRVFGKDEDICNVVYGKSNIEEGIDADEDTVYEWGSISKVLVWVSAMQLYEQGKLDLNADIREYLPEGFLDNLKYDDPITMLNLMNHDAGFMSPYKDMETINISDLMTLEDALKEIAPVQEYHPGEVVAYSNYGAALAAYVIECVSGMDYADYVKINIFDKLGMKHTSIRPDCSDNQWVSERRRETYCYSFSGEDGLTSLGECRYYIQIYPAGAACGTASDLSIFAKALLCDSESCPLFDSDTTLDEMLTPSKYYADGLTPRFCHGLVVEQSNAFLLGHGGNTSGFSSLMEINRENRTGFIMMINLSGDRTYKGGLPELLYGNPDYMAEATSDFEKYDLAGDYTMSGGLFATGCFKLYSFYVDHLKVYREGDAYTGTNGIVRMEQISKNKVLVKLVTGNEYIYYVKTDNDGNYIGLENKSVDIIKESRYNQIIGWGTLILMCFGLLVMMLLLIIHLITFKKYKQSALVSFKKTEIWMGFTCVAMIISMIALAVLGFSYRAVTVTSCIVNAMSALLLIDLNIKCITKCERKNGIVIWMERICSLFIITGMIYWRLFQFWGF